MVKLSFSLVGKTRNEYKDSGAENVCYMDDLKFSET